MLKAFSWRFAGTAVAAFTAAFLGGAFTGTVTAKEGGKGAYVLDHRVQDIRGKDVDLEAYKGKVLLIVNVASECGLTPQYEQLVELNKKCKDKGLRILGFPANNFAGQEPGTNEEIYEFCTSNFGVDFDMMTKISVKGEDIHPLYKELTSKKTNGAFGGEIQWNFTKFLVSRDGNVIARFEPKVRPDAEAVIAAIERELARESSRSKAQS